MKALITLSHLFLTLFLSIKVDAQLDKAATLNFVDNELEKFNGLINGIGYEYTLINQSNPFYRDESWSKAIIEYNGNVYDDVLAIYDINRDLLVIQVRDRDLVHPISLIPERLQSFQIFGDEFIKLKIESGELMLHKVFDGESISFFRRYEKSRSYSNSLQKVVYETSISEFVYLDGQLTELKRKSSLGKQSQKVRNLIKRYMSEYGRQNLNIEKNFLSLLKFLDSEL